MTTLLSKFIDHLKDKATIETAKNFEIQMKNYCYKTITEVTNAY